MTVWNFIVAHWGYISAAAILVLKWIYNAWTPGVTFPQFIRQFIGEVVQEPAASPLTDAQKKLLAEAPHA
jgi:hypothetical protein